MKKNIIEHLHSQGLIKPPSFVLGGLQYLAMMGSEAYGVSSNSSDIDVYGFCIPPKNYTFPHLDGYIYGFGIKPQGFDQFQQHHVYDSSNQKEYDLTVYSIVKYIDLCMGNNPNMIDSLFVPTRCVLHATKIAEIVRERRKDFLHKGAWHSFKGYAYAQMRKIDVKTPEMGSKRAELVDKYGFDIKFAYHVVRLLNEVEQILVEGDLVLDKNREQLKAIREGMWTLEQVKEYFYEKEKTLEEVYNKSTLPWGPDEGKIKGILMSCLEEFYGSLEGCEASEQSLQRAFSQMAQIVDNNRKLII